MRQYVKLHFRLPGGKTRQVWAEKIGPRSYWHVDREGDRNPKGVREFILLGEGDVVSEAPAQMNLKHGELETVVR